MRIYLLQTERLLIEVDGWSIIQQHDCHKNDAYASHQCLGPATHAGGRINEGKPVYGEGCWFREKRPIICAYCKEAVPESIQTLISIHTWER